MPSELKDQLKKLIEEGKSCRDCRKLFGFEPNPVFYGQKKAKIVQISQAPSNNVHKTGKPFDDASGKKLIGEWYRISDKEFYDKSNFYISGIGHCYPGKSPNGGDRKPPKRCAEKWLRRELQLVDNSMYILIGRNAALYFFHDKDHKSKNPRSKSFTELVFSDQEISGRPAIILPHPSPLNQKWFKDNPKFLSERLPEIRKRIHRVLGR